MKVRKAAVSGMFYPKHKEEIENMIDSFLSNIPIIKIKKELKALIVPHAGYIYSGQVAAYAYSLLRKYKNKKKIVLLGPSHFVYFNDLVSDVNDCWETPLGKVKIIKNDFLKLEEPHKREHCLEVQLPFLQKTLENFEILPLVAGDIDPRKISNKISSELENNSILIISSDLSHNYTYDKAVNIDKNTNMAIQDLDYDKVEREAEACGKIPILIAIDIAKKLNWKCKLLNYKNSGDITSYKNNVVGYAAFVFY